jgi:hypothetical protein
MEALSGIYLGCGGRGCALLGDDRMRLPICANAEGGESSEPEALSCACDRIC